MMNLHHSSSSAGKWSSVLLLVYGLFLATVIMTFAACSEDEANSIKIIAHSPPGAGSGKVVSLHQGATIDCNVVGGTVSGACFDDFNDLDGDPSFQLQANANPGSIFLMWGGCPSATGNLCTIDVGVDVHTEVSALFDLAAEAPPR